MKKKTINMLFVIITIIFLIALNIVYATEGNQVDTLAVNIIPKHNYTIQLKVDNPSPTTNNKIFNVGINIDGLLSQNEIGTYEVVVSNNLNNPKQISIYELTDFQLYNNDTITIKNINKELNVNINSRYLNNVSGYKYINDNINKYDTNNDGINDKQVVNIIKTCVTITNKISGTFANKDDSITYYSHSNIIDSNVGKYIQCGCGKFILSPEGWSIHHSQCMSGSLIHDVNTITLKNNESMDIIPDQNYINLYISNNNLIQEYSYDGNIYYKNNTFDDVDDGSKIDLNINNKNIIIKNKTIEPVPTNIKTNKYNNMVFLFILLFYVIVKKINYKKKF